MKKLIVLIMICAVATAALFAQDGASPIATGLGIEVTSDGVAGIVVRARTVEAALTIQAMLFDIETEGAGAPNRLDLGTHIAYLVRPGSSATDFGIGVDLRFGFGTGDVDYDEWIDAALRLSVSHALSDSFLVSGILKPFLVQTRDVSDIDDDWQLTATIPTAAVAVTYLF